MRPQTLYQTIIFTKNINKQYKKQETYKVNLQT